MRGLSLRVHLPVLLFLSLKLRCVTPSGADLSVYNWCKDKHGEFIAHPLDCSKFIRCSHDRAYVFQCPVTLRWNQAIKTCDWEQRTKCLLDSVADVEAGNGDIKKKSVKRDTSLHTEVYQSSPESSTFSSTAKYLAASEGLGSHTLKEELDAAKSSTQVLDNFKVTEYPINLKTADDNLFTTLKSIFKTPCTKNSHITKVKSTSLPSTTYNIIEYVNITESTYSNSYENEATTEADNVEDTIFKHSTNSKDAIRELSSNGPHQNLFATGFPLSAAKDRTYNNDESLSLTPPFKKSPQNDTQTTETLTVPMTQQPYETIIASELPDISREFHNEISKRISSVPIEVLTEISTGTIIPESTTVGEHDETSLTENQNDNESKFTELSNETFNSEFDSTKSDVELTEYGNIDFVFTSVVTDTLIVHDLEITESTTENVNTILTDSDVVTEQSVTGNNWELTENGNIKNIFTSVVTVPRTEHDLETTEIGSTMLTENVVVIEQNEMGINVTSVVTESLAEHNLGTTESTTENGSTMLTDTVVATEQDEIGINVVLTEDVYTESILTSVVTETQTEHDLATIEIGAQTDNTMLTESVVVTEHNFTDINLELTEDGNIEFVTIQEIQKEHDVGTTESTTENDKIMLTESLVLTEQNVTETQTDHGLGTTENVNTMLGESVVLTTENVIDISVVLTEGDNTGSVLTSVVTETPTKHDLEITESTTEYGNTMLTKPVVTTVKNLIGINVALTEGNNTESIFITAVTEPQNELYVETTEFVIADVITTSANSVDITEQNVTDLNIELTQGGNTELILTTVVAETQKEHYLGTTESDNSMTKDSVEEEEYVDSLTELPTTINTTIIADDFSKRPIESTSDEMQTLTTEVLTVLYADTPSDLTEALTNPGTETETTSPSAENLKETSTYVNTVNNIQDTENLLTKTSRDVTEELTETSTFVNTVNNMYPEKLTDSMLNENVLTTFALQDTETPEFLTETSRDVTENLTESTTNVMTIINDYITESTRDTTPITQRLDEENIMTTLTDSLHDKYITINSVKLTDVTVQGNVMTNSSHNEIELMNNISTEVNTELTENLTDAETDTEATTYTVKVTETSTNEGAVTTLTVNNVKAAFELLEDFTEIVISTTTQDDFTETGINSTNLTETAAINFEDIENTTPQNSITKTLILSTTSYTDSDQEATEIGDFSNYGLEIAVTDKIGISTPTTEEPVTDTFITDTMLNINSDTYIMFNTTTVVPSTVITDSVTATKTLFEEVVDNSQMQKDNEFNGDPSQEPLLAVTPTSSAMLLSLIKNEMSSDVEVNNNLISPTVLTSKTLDPTLDGGALSNEMLDISTTADPRLPFRSPKCRGDNNNRQFKASKCSQYFQCFAGWAFLLNCYEGYLFVTQEATCIRDINQECNE